KQDRDREASDFTGHQFEGFDPSAPAPGFSFANEKVASQDDLSDVIQRLRWRAVSESLIEAFKRGIGVHHAGMNRVVSSLNPKLNKARYTSANVVIVSTNS